MISGHWVAVTQRFFKVGFAYFQSLYTPPKRFTGQQIRSDVIHLAQTEKYSICCLPVLH